VATGMASSLGTPFTSCLVGLLVNMPGLVGKQRGNLALVMERCLVKMWQTGQLIWPGSDATPERICVYGEERSGKRRISAMGFADVELELAMPWPGHAARAGGGCPAGSCCRPLRAQECCPSPRTHQHTLAHETLAFGTAEGGQGPAAAGAQPAGCQLRGRAGLADLLSFCLVCIGTEPPQRFVLFFLWFFALLMLRIKIHDLGLVSNSLE